MRIIHIIFSLPNAGKENMLVDIANEQFKLNYEVGIIVINNNVEKSIRERIIKGIELFELNRSRSSKSILPVIKLIILLRKKFKADVIHVHDPEIGKLIRLLCRTPVVLTVHNTNMNVGPMKNYSKVFAISKTVKLDIESRSKLKCEVIYNGIKTRDIQKRDRFDAPDIYKIIFVKRLDYKAKGQDLLVHAINFLIKDRGVKNIRLDLAGEGKSRDFIQKLIDDLNLGEHVFLLGNKSREWVYKNLHEYDLFVHPSRIEGFGLSVVEAMAAKVPVIASNIEGPAEILEYGKFGIMFENDNYEDLAKQIENAMRLYNNRGIVKLIESAYNHCIINFDITRTAKEYCDSYL
jgi:glycosyltransferase involved in cell wall biosynthesis